MSTGQFWFTLYSVVHSNIWLFLKIWYHIPSVCIIWYTDPNLIVLIGMFTYAFRGKWDDSFRTHSRHSHIEPWFPGHKSMGCAPNDVTSSKNFGRYGKSTISRSFCFPNGNSMDFHIFVILPDGTARKKITRLEDVILFTTIGLHVSGKVTSWLSWSLSGGWVDDISWFNWWKAGTLWLWLT